VISKWQLLLVLWAIVIVISAIGMRSLYVETHAVCEVSEKSPTMIKIRAQEHLNGFLGLEISIRSLTDKPVIAPEILAKADKMVEYLRNRPETLRAWALTDYMKVMNKAAHEGQEEFYRLPDSVEAVDQFILLYTFTPAGRREINGLISEDRKWLRIVGRVKDVGASKYLKLCADLNELASKLFSGSEVEVRVTSESYLLHVAMNNILRDVLNSVMWAFIFIGILVGISLRSLRYGLVAIMPNLIPLFTTLGMMGYSGIALRVGTAVVFSVGLGIAVDNTIHCLEEYRRFKERGLSYSEAILKIYQTATPRMIYASVVLILGFLGISFATFKSVWQMGVLCSFLIAIALSADMLLTLLLVRFTELPVFSEMRGNETRK
jgi:predicted RND superfamily exporter protein